MRDKVEYVRARMKQPARGHHCHWPGCTKKMPASMWGCSRHWYMLPTYLRLLIWNTFKPGQEIAKNPSQDYLDAADQVQKWIKRYYPEAGK